MSWSLCIVKCSLFLFTTFSYLRGQWNSLEVLLKKLEQSKSVQNMYPSEKGMRPWQCCTNLWRFCYGRRQASGPVGPLVLPQTFLGSATGTDATLPSRDLVVTLWHKVPLSLPPPPSNPQKKVTASLRDTRQLVVFLPLKMFRAFFLYICGQFSFSLKINDTFRKLIASFYSYIYI